MLVFHLIAVCVGLFSRKASILCFCIRLSMHLLRWTMSYLDFFTDMVERHENSMVVGEDAWMIVDWRMIIMLLPRSPLAPVCILPGNMAFEGCFSWKMFQLMLRLKSQFQWLQMATNGRTLQGSSYALPHHPPSSAKPWHGHFHKSFSFDARCQPVPRLVTVSQVIQQKGGGGLVAVATA